eukprot:6516405-Pyramimonas_sp.AAC.1
MRDNIFAGDVPPPPSGREAPRPRPPRPEPRVVDAAAGRAPADWASFDLAQSLRMLRKGRSQLRRE